MSEETNIEGVLDRVIYANPENAWSVVRLVVGDRGEVTAVGNLLGAQPGENLRLSGQWVKDRRFGKQFKVTSYLTVEPKTFLGLEKYLGSGLIKGIGKELAKRLVSKFGLETLEVIEHQPDRLLEVEGIGAKRSRQICGAFAEQRHIKQVMVFLQSHGVTTTFAIKIFKRYGAESVAAVRENPYRLAQEITGIGFQSADKIAHDLGISKESPHRVAAGVLYTLEQAATSGHVFQPTSDLEQAAAELLDIPRALIQEPTQALVRQGRLTAVERESGDAALYLTPLENAERLLAERLGELTAQHHLKLRIDIRRAITWFESHESLTLASQQRYALERSITSKVLVITGGPGTGKTTLVRGIVRILEKKKLRVLLAAPTGRAAKRLGEATGGEAKTVHRMLEYQPRQREFARNADNPLNADLLVVDEASMLDTVLAHHILQAVPDEARLILVGDADQLPSVGPGRVLEDLLESGAVEVVRLTEIFRQALGSLIVTNAHRVRIGEMPELRRAEDGADFFFIERERPEDVLAVVRHLVAERIPRRFGFDPMEAIQVLTPMQRGLLGAGNLNSELQSLLNGEGPSIRRADRQLRVGDRVMQIRNNYDLEVFNGDIGRLSKIDLEEQQAQVDYDGKEVTYELSNLDELVLAYACSIHKSQGSEYPCVVIPLHTQHYTMLQRNLLYTALTRGRKLVVIVGSRRALGVAVRTETSTRRRTLLTERLRRLATKG